MEYLKSIALRAPYKLYIFSHSSSLGARHYGLNNRIALRAQFLLQSFPKLIDLCPMVPTVPR